MCVVPRTPRKRAASMKKACLSAYNVYVSHVHAAVNPAPESGATGTPPSMGTGLYELACRASHSCQPNCFWFSDNKGQRVVRTLVDVAAGEEVSLALQTLSGVIKD